MVVVDKAIIFASKAHRNQTRKGTNIPYITHPFAVGMLLQKAKCTEEVIAAGILHDTLEDTETTFDDLTEEFGVRVANLVLAASENDKSLPWRVRKQHTIEILKDVSLEEIQVIVADKLHNLKSIRTDIYLDGDTIWQRFKRGKRDQHWYYASIVKALSPRKKEFKMIGELEKEVKAVFGSLHILTVQEISLLFSCAYFHIDEAVRKLLESNQLIHFAEDLIKEAEDLFRNQYSLAIEKLEDLQSRGIEFQSNSQGPLIFASFCIAFQKNMQWSNQELYQHFKKNSSRL